MKDSRTTLNEIAQSLEDVCSHIDVRVDDDDTPYIFAIGSANVHSLELRITDKGLFMELWKGPVNEDVFIGRETLDTGEAASPRCRDWLELDRDV